MRRSEPIFNVPGSVIAVLVILAAVHLAREELLADRTGLWVVYALGFVPARYTEDGSLLPGWPWSAVLSPVTHMLLHGDWVHLGVNAAWLLAVGTPLARRLGALRFVLFGLASGISGAFLFLLLNPWLDAPVVGASGAISGLMGGMFRLMFAADSLDGRHLLRERPDLAPRLELVDFIRDRRAMTAVAVFIAINVLVAFGLPGMGTTSGGIAWEAHVGGFLCGVLAFEWFDREPPTPPLSEPWGDQV